MQNIAKIPANNDDKGIHGYGQFVKQLESMLKSSTRQSDRRANNTQD